MIKAIIHFFSREGPVWREETAQDRLLKVLADKEQRDHDLENAKEIEEAMEDYEAKKEFENQYNDEDMKKLEEPMSPKDLESYYDAWKETHDL